ncbi:hypothetical protein BaRGS_00021042, partial [Batillaria attramentaria]
AQLTELSVVVPNAVTKRSLASRFTAPEDSSGPRQGGVPDEERAGQPAGSKVDIVRSWNTFRACHDQVKAVGRAEPISRHNNCDMLRVDEAYQVKAALSDPRKLGCDPSRRQTATAARQCRYSAEDIWHWPLGDGRGGRGKGGWGRRGDAGDELTQKARTGDELTQKARTGDELTQKARTGDKLTQKARTGDELTQKARTGDKLTQKARTGDELTQKARTGDELTQKARTGDELTQKARTGDELTQKARTGDELTQKARTGDELTQKARTHL